MSEQNIWKTQLNEIWNADKAEFESMSDAIWEFAEVCFQEKQSSTLQMEYLSNRGFRIIHPIGDMDTAFYAEYGSGYPVIAICGEYDALPGLANTAGLPMEEHPDPPASGHGCCHNLLGTAGVETVCAIAKLMEKQNIPGTIRYYGCPAEEGGGGKSKMIQAGAFRDADIALSWHPGFDAKFYVNGLALQSYIFSFKGISSHASVAPEKGRSALDAAELMNIGTNFLREHLKNVSVQYAFLNAGGKLENIIPDYAKLKYTLRAHTVELLKDAETRLMDIARGAALMSGTQLLPVEKITYYENIVPNNVIFDVMATHIATHFPIEYTPEEIALMRQFQAVGSAPNAPYPIVRNFDYNRHQIPRITTDFGDVSRVLPSGSFCIPTVAIGTRVHNWAMTAQGCTSYAKKSMHVAAIILAETAVNLMLDHSIVEKAKAEFREIMACG
ncbi:MAG: amidohydrolase [Clostridiales bacterium]|nr:amidohydrolase [Clostridiales bacterium]